MPVNIISQKDLENFSLRGDEREETGYYKDNFYPNGVPRPEELRGTARKLPHTERRETALDIAVRELKLLSNNRKTADGHYVRPPRNDRNKQDDRRDASASKVDVKMVENGAEIYGSELPPLKKSGLNSVKTGWSNNGTNPWRRATPEKPKPERLESDVLDSQKGSKSSAKEADAGDSTPENGAKEASSEPSEATAITTTLTESTTETAADAATETTTETTESEKPDSESETAETGMTTETSATPPPNSAKAESLSTPNDRQKPESQSPPSVKGNVPKPPVIPPPFYKSMIHPIKEKDGQIVPLIDIGANLTKLCYKDRIGSILERAKAAGVTTVLITGTSYNSSCAAIRLCRDWDGYEGVKLRATAGLHPLDAAGVLSGKYANRWCGSLERLLKEDTGYVVAVGECGLDYKAPTFDPEHDPQAQKQVFMKQLMLADKYHLPVFAHCRDAHTDFMKIANPWLKKAHPVRLVVHCHTDPDPKHLKELLDAGAWIGLTGIITDKREGRFNEAIINQIPWDRLMIETDAPFLLPSNACAIRDIDPKWQNEPCLLPFVAEKIAVVDGYITAVEVASITTKNSITFFGLED